MSGRAGRATQRRLLMQAAALVWACLAALGSVACDAGSPPVVFTSDRDGNLEVYSVDADGKSERNLTNSPANEFAPVVSPDRTLIAFLSGDGNNVSIEAMRAGGGERWELTSATGKHGSQRWAPDSQRLAYVATAGEQSYNLRRVRAGRRPDAPYRHPRGRGRRLVAGREDRGVRGEPAGPTGRVYQETQTG